MREGFDMDDVYTSSSDKAQQPPRLAPPLQPPVPSLVSLALKTIHIYLQFFFASSPTKYSFSDFILSR